MELRRFYIKPEDRVGDEIIIRGEEFRHMTGVLRFRVGYQAIVCDGSGRDLYCHVVDIDKHRALLCVDREDVNEIELSYPLWLCMGNIKPDRLEMAVQKAVEIGVSDIVVFESTYTSEKGLRLDRIERIVLEACKQCGRATLPIVHPLCAFADMLDQLTLPAMIAYEKEDTVSMQKALQEHFSKERGLAVIVGSEGGFTKDEVALAEEKGCTSYSLGKRILRAETAAIVSLGNVVFYTEE